MGLPNKHPPWTVRQSDTLTARNSQLVVRNSQFAIHNLQKEVTYERLVSSPNPTKAAGIQ